MLLAEFAALRAEIVARISAQVTIIGLGVTGLGLILGFVIRDNGDQRLLLAIPPLSAMVAVLHAAESYRVKTLGNYIRDNLWPNPEGQVGAIPGWESLPDRQRLNAQNVFAGALFGGYGP